MRREARRADLAFLWAHPAHWVALGAGTGLLRPAPGTWATAAAWLLFAAVQAGFGGSGPAPILTGIAGLAAGTWAAQRTGAALGRPDAGEIVIDEIVAFWWVLALLPDRGWSTQLWAFLLFRLFDIAKPAPIRWLERRRPEGLAVMLDDLMAAAYTLLVVQLWIRLA